MTTHATRERARTARERRSDAPDTHHQHKAKTASTARATPDADRRLIEAGTSTATVPAGATAPGRVRKRAHPARDTAGVKRMSAGRNPKSDPPKGRRGDEEGDEVESEEPAPDPELDPILLEAEEQAESESEEKAKRKVRAAARRMHERHDRAHRTKKAKVAKNKRRLDALKAKGAIPIAASNAARTGERAANAGKHGLLNAGRSIGRLVRAKVKPNTTVKMAVGANTTDTASGAYGAVDTEFIEPSFTVKLIGTTWHPIVTKLHGTYGKITSPLPGLAEVTGPDAIDSRQQILDLLNLDGDRWYMERAVNAHESVHEAHVHDALNNVGDQIAQLFAGLTVDKSVAPNAAAAIAAIKALPGYDAIVNLADPNDSQIRGIWDAEYVNLIDRDHYGPTQDAEGDKVEPMIDKINTWRKKHHRTKVKKRWTCTDDDDNVRPPKGRKA